MGINITRADCTYTTHTYIHHHDVPWEKIPMQSRRTSSLHSDHTYRRSFQNPYHTSRARCIVVSPITGYTARHGPQAQQRRMYYCKAFRPQPKIRAPDFIWNDLHMNSYHRLRPMAFLINEDNLAHTASTSTAIPPSSQLQNTPVHPLLLELKHVTLQGSL